jgi:hypothetical protein
MQPENTRKKKAHYMRLEKKNHKNNKMAVITTNLLILTLNVNDLNSPMKRHRMVGWIKNQGSTTCCLQ